MHILSPPPYTAAATSTADATRDKVNLSFTDNLCTCRIHTPSTAEYPWDRMAQNSLERNYVLLVERTLRRALRSKQVPRKRNEKSINIGMPGAWPI